MTEIEVQLSNRLGLHARAAARFVQLASTFQSQVTVAREGSRVDGRSILGLLTLAAREGSVLRVAADGPDEADAVAQLDALVRDRFGEDR